MADAKNVVVPLKKLNASEMAVHQLREVARYLDEHAEALCGDMESVAVLNGGLTFSFTLADFYSVPTVEVRHEYIALNREEVSDGR
ncbi:MAG: hypothetical protein IJH04_05695 [Eggerthellaceae bacterium]|nr:hypothetical protein [Eggerthellaceae bacterium]